MENEISLVFAEPVMVCVGMCQTALLALRGKSGLKGWLRSHMGVCICRSPSILHDVGVETCYSFC